MENSRQSKPGCHEQPPELDGDLYNINQHPGNKNVFNAIYNSNNLVETRIRYINESTQNISIIQGNGFTLDVPKGNTVRNRVMICVTIQWGSDCDINIGALKKHLPSATEQTLNDILNSIKSDPLEYGSREITFYYPVDLYGLDNTPDGIWIEDLSIQIISTKWSEQAIHHPKNSHGFTLESEEDESFTPGSIIGINYYTDLPNITEPLYMLFGNDALLLKPVYVLGFKPGVHIQLNGNADFAARVDGRKSLYISPKNYRLYGIYNSAREVMDLLKSEKGHSKEHIERMLACFNKYHKTEDERRMSIKDIYIAGDVTIGDVLEVVNELGKAEAVISKIFK